MKKWLYMQKLKEVMGLALDRKKILWNFLQTCDLIIHKKGML
jgi:hypothetical protein